MKRRAQGAHGNKGETLGKIILFFIEKKEDEQEPKEWLTTGEVASYISDTENINRDVLDRLNELAEKGILEEKPRRGMDSKWRLKTDEKALSEIYSILPPEQFSDFYETDFYRKFEQFFEYKRFLEAFKIVKKLPLKERKHFDFRYKDFGLKRPDNKKIKPKKKKRGSPRRVKSSGR